MITEDYVSFEVAKLLKEKGFREICNKCYGIESKKFFSSIRSNDDDTMYAAPTLQMAMKWLRDVHNLHIEARITNHSMSSLCEVVKYYWVVFNTTNAKWVNESSVYTLYFNTYEDACASAIKNCLENLI